MKRVLKNFVYCNHISKNVGDISNLRNIFLSELATLM